MPSTGEELSSISLILSAAHHRHKNQHRIAKWWKSFCVLRRNLDKLVSEIEKWERDLKLVGETKWTVASRETVEKRVDFMMEWIIPKCYVAFSDVIADQQFADLGLMLLATLARIRKLIEPYRKEEPEAEIHETHTTTSMGFANDDDVDYGEVVTREDLESLRSSAKRGTEDVDQDLSKSEKKEKRSNEKRRKTSGRDIGETASKKKKRKSSND